MMMAATSGGWDRRTSLKVCWPAVGCDTVAGSLSSSLDTGMSIVGCGEAAGRACGARTGLGAGCCGYPYCGGAGTIGYPGCGGRAP